jgi:RNA recognition motif-containing protein
MAKRLYVGNLSWNVTDEDLREVFQADGRQVVDARVITDRETGRSRGFGFVEFASSEEGAAAIEALDGHELDGRPMRVNEAQERSGGGGGGGGGRHGGGGGGRRW